MSRPLRIEYPGATYQITVRGNGDSAIFFDDDDRNTFLKNLGVVCEKFNWLCHAYCLLDSECQLLIETRDANLSKGMREVNGVYTQALNRKHKRRGHVLEGRYQAIVIEKALYLAEIHRKIVLLPIHRKLVETLMEWQWSNYAALMGKSWSPKWLGGKDFLKSFSENTGEARRRYEKFIEEDGFLLREFKPHAQILLGSEQFREQIRLKLDLDSTEKELTKKQKSFTSLIEFEKRHLTRNMAIKAAFESGGYSLKEIGAHFNLHYATVSRIARRKSS